MPLCTMSGITIAQLTADKRISIGDCQRHILGCLAAQKSELLTEADL